MEEKQSGSHHAKKNYYKNMLDEYRKPVKGFDDSSRRAIANKFGGKALEVGIKAQDKKRAENIKKAVKGKEVHNSRHAGREAVNDFIKYGPQRARNVKKMANEYVSDTKDLVKRHIKESVLDWYDENDIEINDYEMGRIDSFVENYIEENYSED
jgi:hypothetical protein